MKNWKKNLSFEIVFTSNVKKEIQKLPKKEVNKILNFLKQQSLRDNPRTQGKPLKGKLREFWRYRVGQFRIISKIEDKQLIVLVVRIAHRKNAYRS